MATEAAIRTESLTKWYGQHVLALDSLHLEVEPGEIFGFLGPNGAGKTTTIRLLLDLIRPTRGEAAILGMDCQRESVRVRAQVGYLPGELNLYQGMDGNALVRLFSGLRPDPASPDYVEYLRDCLDIDMETPFRDLSHGNRQKIGLMLALMARPALLILDEPTTGLDPLAQHHVLRLLQEIRAEGRTIFLSSHILSEVERVCDRVAIIRAGRLAAVERVETLQERRFQRLKLTFAEPVDARAFSQLPGVGLLDATDHTLHLEVTGEVDAVVKCAAGHHVVALETEQPSLDEIFMAYYRDEVPAGKVRDD